MFTSEARAFHRGASFTLHSEVGSWLYLKRYTRLKRTARDKYSSLVRKAVNYRPKKFYNIGPCAQCSNILYVRNLTSVCNKLEHLSLASFQVSLMFVIKARAYPRMCRLSSAPSTVGQAPGLTHIY
jgi:hypothetical protein